MDPETLQQKATDKGRKNNQLQDLQRQESGSKCLLNLSEPLQGPTGHHGAKAKGCQRPCVYVCGVAEDAENTQAKDRNGTNKMDRWCLCQMRTTGIL